MKNNITSALSRIIISLVVIMCFSGCVIVNFFEFNTARPLGDQVTYELEVSEYNGIRIDGFCDVHYYAPQIGGASANTVILKVQSNLRQYYIVEVIRGELIVRTTGRISFGQKKAASLTIYTPVLNSVSMYPIRSRGNTGSAYSFTAYDPIVSDSFTFILKGDGDGRAELDVNSLNVELAGAGKLELSGRADNINFNLSGVGELNSFSLQARDTIVSLTGAGAIKLNSSETLIIEANGAGSIEYIGNPSLNLNTNGMVNVIRVD